MTKEIPELIGQDNMLDLFGRALDTGRIPHALIISGNRGSGKLEIARFFAMKVLGTEDPNHKDIRIIGFAKTMPRYTNVIREEVVNDMQLIPMGAEHKFYIVKDAGSLPAQAQNALLKSFEEPPEYAHVILLTEDVGKLLPTIRSRAIYLYMKPVETAKIKEYLIKCGSEENVAEICAALSMGDLKKAVAYSENPEGLQYAEELCEIFMRIAVGERPPLFFHHQLQGFREDYEKFTELMEIFLRDVLVYKLTENPGDVFTPWKNNIKKISTKCSFDRLGAISKALTNLKIGSMLNAGVDNLFDILFVEIGGSV